MLYTWDNDTGEPIAMSDAQAVLCYKLFVVIRAGKMERCHAPSSIRDVDKWFCIMFSPVILYIEKGKNHTFTRGG